MHSLGLGSSTMPAGRPSKLPTPEIQEEICRYIAEGGNYNTVSAIAAGVAPRTFQRWCQKGRKAKRGLFAEFWRAIKKAEALAEIANVKVVMEAAQNDPKHAEWWLTHKRPEHWASNRNEITELKKAQKALENGYLSSIAQAAAKTEKPNGASTTSSEGSAAVGDGSDFTNEKRRAGSGSMAAGSVNESLGESNAPLFPPGGQEHGDSSSRIA